MKRFDIKRFVNVARWDLAVNRPFYTKMFMLIAACVLIPVLLRYGFFLTGAFNWVQFEGEIPDEVDMMAVRIMFFSCIMYVVAMGYMFHNLRDRQGRINELTLPATNLERFLWHAIFAVVGPTLSLLVSVVIADLAHVILGWAVMGQHSFKSLTLALFDNMDNIPLLNFHDEDGLSRSGSLFMLLMGWSFTSTFALGNAWKYRHNVVFTLLFHIALGLLCTFVMGFVMAFVYDKWSGFEGFFLYLSQHRWILQTLLIGFALIVFCAIWVLTYILYCKAQITSKRNR